MNPGRKSRLTCVVSCFCSMATNFPEQGETSEEMPRDGPKETSQASKQMERDKAGRLLLKYFYLRTSMTMLEEAERMKIGGMDIELSFKMTRKQLIEKQKNLELEKSKEKERKTTVYREIGELLAGNPETISSNKDLLAEVLIRAAFLTYSRVFDIYREQFPENKEEGDICKHFLNDNDPILKEYLCKRYSKDKNKLSKAREMHEYILTVTDKAIVHPVTTSAGVLLLEASDTGSKIRFTVLDQQFSDEPYRSFLLEEMWRQILFMAGFVDHILDGFQFPQMNSAGSYRCSETKCDQPACPCRHPECQAPKIPDYTEEEWFHWWQKMGSFAEVEALRNVTENEKDDMYVYELGGDVKVADQLAGLWHMMHDLDHVVRLNQFMLMEYLPKQHYEALVIAGVELYRRCFSGGRVGLKLNPADLRMEVKVKKCHETLIRLRNNGLRHALDAYHVNNKLIEELLKARNECLQKGESNCKLTPEPMMRRLLRVAVPVRALCAEKFLRLLQSPEVNELEKLTEGKIHRMGFKKKEHVWKEMKSSDPFAYLVPSFPERRQLYVPPIPRFLVPNKVQLAPTSGCGGKKSKAKEKKRKLKAAERDDGKKTKGSDGGKEKAKAQKRKCGAQDVQEKSKAAKSDGEKREEREKAKRDKDNDHDADLGGLFQET